MSNFAPCGQWSLFWPGVAAQKEGNREQVQEMFAKPASGPLFHSPYPHLYLVCVCEAAWGPLESERRQKMRFADQWSLKHIYNEPEPGHVGCRLTWSKPQSPYPLFHTPPPDQTRANPFSTRPCKMTKRQAIKSMPKLIYLATRWLPEIWQIANVFEIDCKTARVSEMAVYLSSSWGGGYIYDINYTSYIPDSWLNFHSVSVSAIPWHFNYVV